MNRAGLEPATYGLTCRTGFHQPFQLLRSGLYHLPKREPHVKSLRSPCHLLHLLNPLRVLQRRHLTRFPADCPIRQIFTLSRTDGSQGVPAYGAVLPPAFRPGHSYLKSVALPTELPIHQDAGQIPVSLVSLDTRERRHDTKKRPIFQRRLPPSQNSRRIMRGIRISGIFSATKFPATLTRSPFRQSCLSVDARFRRSGKHGLHKLSVNIGEPEISALIFERELFVVNTKQMQNRGVQVMHMNRITNNVVAVFVCFTEG